MKYEWLHHNTFQLLFAIFFSVANSFTFSTKLKQKCTSASEFDLFCKRARQALSNSLTSSVAEVFRFLFCRVLELYCKFVIIGSRMKELFTGLWNNWLAWRRHLLLSTESLRTWWSGDINITFWHCWISCCNTISDNTFKKVQFIVKLTSWYFRSRCPPDFALSLSLFQRHGYAFTWPIKHWSSFGLKLEDSWDTGEPSLGGSSLSISRENVWLVFFLL